MKTKTFITCTKCGKKEVWKEYWGKEDGKTQYAYSCSCGYWEVKTEA